MSVNMGLLGGGPPVSGGLGAVGGMGGPADGNPAAAGLSSAQAGYLLDEREAQALGNTVSTYSVNGKVLEIRDVWAHNLEDEMERIREAATRFKYVAMDSEFPGVVARPVTEYTQDYAYQTMRCNVDLLRLIQLGFAFTDDRGELPEDFPCCWQFHFKFSLSDDMYAQDSIDLLVRSGIRFELHEEFGIDPQDFGALLTSSGLVLMDDVTWLAFHGGYDFGYLVKALTSQPLPAEEDAFFELLRDFFPSMYDIKHLMMLAQKGQWAGGLNSLAEDLGAERVGPMHQAGSDALLTAKVFFKVREKHFAKAGVDPRAKCVIHGLGDGDLNRTAKRSAAPADGGSGSGSGSTYYPDFRR